MVTLFGDGAEFLGMWAGAAAAEVFIMLFGLAGGDIAGLAIAGLIEGLMLLFTEIFNTQ